MKAFLGMGLLGSNFVRAMVKKGGQVHVWNRTASKARDLEADGAKAFNAPDEAANGADIIHVTLKDDDSVDDVLAQTEKGLKPGATIVDHTTTSAEGARKRTAAWKAKGFTYLHAPVFMGPANALESSGYMLVSGDQEVIQKMAPHLAAMTGKLINLGQEEGKAAGMKLVGNLFLLSLNGGLTDTLALAKAQGIAPAEVLDLFGTWNPGAGMPARLKRITEANFSKPSWELNMARKDAGLMMSAAQKAGVELNIIPSVAELMDKWIEKGHGNDDWSIIAKDSLP